MNNKPSISSKVKYCETNNLVTVCGDTLERTQIFAFIDGIALHLWKYGINAREEFRFRVPATAHSYAVREAVSTLAIAIRGVQVRIEDELGNTIDSKPPDFSERCADWAELLLARETVGNLPPIAHELKMKIDSDSFVWYRTTSSSNWSGRVDGLRVCTIKPDGRIRIGVGKESTKPNGASAYFKHICSRHPDVRIEEEFPLDVNNLEHVADLIRDLCDDRANGRLRQVEPEHHLESRVRRDDVAIWFQSQRLKPVNPPPDLQFQFPAKWSTRDKGRNFIDVVACLGKVPWVLELKMPKTSRSCLGQEYRHAVAQAALYRHFIRSAKQLHFWFEDRKLDPNICRAAVAFPKVSGDDISQLLGVARCFDVELIPLDVIVPQN